MKLAKRIIFILIVLAIVGLIILALLPSPMKVEAGRVERGLLRVTISEEGEARAHDRFVIASPVAGRAERIELHDGDEVKAGQVVAVINPAPLDVKEKAEVTARVQAAESLKREADQHAEHALKDYEQSRRERERAESLARSGVIATQVFEQARNAEATSRDELEAARFKAQAAASEVKIARAGLIAIDGAQADAGRVIRLRSPVSGRVLRVIEKSERVVAAGAPLIIVGDPAGLEIVVDLLSTDAVKVKAGMAVLIEGWGGDRSIRASLRAVESSAFTKVSALGIEEQRVNVLADFVDPPDPLGDGFRVEAKIIIWESDIALKVPVSALFRRGEGWAVFAIEGGRAKLREIETGHRSQFEAEVLSGIEEGAEIILHPTNQIHDGARVETR